MDLKRALMLALGACMVVLFCSAVAALVGLVMLVRGF
jgi:hypothetical protein